MRRWVTPHVILLALGTGALFAPAGPALDADATCTAAAELREHLDGVTEAVIDGRLTTLPRAAGRAASWWAAHRSKFEGSLALDTLVRHMVTMARHGQPRESASMAVKVSVESLRWCRAAHSDVHDLMVLGLAGQTG